MYSSAGSWLRMLSAQPASNAPSFSPRCTSTVVSVWYSPVDSSACSTPAPLNTPLMRISGLNFAAPASTPRRRAAPSIGRKRDSSRSCGMSSVSSRLAIVIASPSIWLMIP